MRPAILALPISTYGGQPVDTPRPCRRGFKKHLLDRSKKERRYKNDMNATTCRSNFRTTRFSSSGVYSSKACTEESPLLRGRLSARLSRPLCADLTMSCNSTASLSSSSSSADVRFRVVMSADSIAPQRGVVHLGVLSLFKELIVHAVRYSRLMCLTIPLTNTRVASPAISGLFPKHTQAYVTGTMYIMLHG